MARTALTTQEIADEGIVPTYAAANVAGNMIDGSGDVVLHVKNGSGSSINVTIQTPGNEDGLAIAEQIVAVAAGAEKFIGRFKPTLYTRPDGSADEGFVYVDYSAVTTVTVAALGV